MISIITPVFNQAKYLARAIDSVIKQTITDWEMIIMDDGSTDGSFIVALEYANKDERIKAFELDGNYGQGYARNRAFEKSTGEYIAYIDADDVWGPGHLYLRADILDKNIDTDFVYGAIQDMYQGNIAQPRKNLWNRDVTGYELECLREANITIPSAVMHRRKPFDLLGGFPEGIVCGEDGVLWRRMAEAGYRFSYIDVATFFYCTHGENQNKILHEPKKINGKHLVGEAAPVGQKNGQELDNQWKIDMLNRHGEDWEEKVKK